MQIKEEYLKEIRLLQDEYNKIVISLGELSTQKAMIVKDEEFLHSEWVKKLDAEKVLIDKIKSEYGDGNLDLKTGEFIPSETKN